MPNKIHSGSSLEHDNLVNCGENYTEIRKKIADWRAQQSTLCDVPTCVAQVYGENDKLSQISAFKSYIGKFKIHLDDCNIIYAKQELDEEFK